MRVTRIGVYWVNLAANWFPNIHSDPVIRPPDNESNPLSENFFGRIRGPREDQITDLAGKELNQLFHVSLYSQLDNGV